MLETHSRMAPMTMPGGSVVGRSLSECTTRSTSPDSRLFSSSWDIKQCQSKRLRETCAYFSTSKMEGSDARFTQPVPKRMYMGIHQIVS